MWEKVKQDVKYFCVVVWNYVKSAFKAVVGFFQ